MIFTRIAGSRSNRPEVFCKKVVLKNFTKFTGKHLCQSLFLMKLQYSQEKPVLDSLANKV